MNTCELCVKILDKYKKGILMVKQCFVLHEEVIDVFHENYYIFTIENCHLIFLVSGFLFQWNVERLEMIVFTLMHQKTTWSENILKKNSAKQPV